MSDRLTELRDRMAIERDLTYSEVTYLFNHIDAQAERLRVLEALEAELATLAKLRAEVGAETATAIAREIMAKDEEKRLTCFGIERDEIATICRKHGAEIRETP